MLKVKLLQSTTSPTSSSGQGDSTSDVSSIILKIIFITPRLLMVKITLGKDHTLISYSAVLQLF